MKKLILFIFLIQVILTIFAADNVINYAICTNSSSVIFVCGENVKRSERAAPTEGNDSPIPSFERFKVENQVKENAQDLSSSNETTGQGTEASTPSESPHKRVHIRSADGENIEIPIQPATAATEPAYTVEQTAETPQPKIDTLEAQPIIQSLEAQTQAATPTSESAEIKKEKIETPNESVQNAEKLTDTPKEVPATESQDSKTPTTEAAAPDKATNAKSAEESAIPVSASEAKPEIEIENPTEAKTENSNKKTQSPTVVKPENEAKTDTEATEKNPELKTELPVESKLVTAAETTENKPKPASDAKSDENFTENESSAADYSNLKCFTNDRKTSETYSKKNFVSISYEQCRFSRFSSILNTISAYENLKVLNISSVGLEFFEVMKGADHLEVILASHNNLTQIPYGLFEHSNGLVRLDLSHNSISKIDLLAFADLTQLKFLNLSFNSLTTVDPTIFAKIVNLVDLDLSNNKIATIDAQLFGPLLNLNELNLSGNLIEKIDGSTFNSLKQLQHLDLSNLKLTDLEPGTFSHQTELKSLNLSENYFNRINFDIFSGLVNLEKFNLNGNELLNLDGFKIDSFPKLTQFVINENHFNCSYLDNFFKTITMKSVVFVNGQPIQSGDSVNGVLCKKSNASLEQFIEAKLHKMVNSVEECVSTMKLTLALLCLGLFVFIIFTVALRRKFNKARGRSVIYELTEDVDGRREGKAVICT